MKFTAIHKKPNNFQPGSMQYNAHDTATYKSNPDCFYTAKYFVFNGVIYRKTPKLVVGVVHRSTKGGKWEVLRLDPRDSIESLLERINAKPANFKDEPKI